MRQAYQGDLRFCSLQTRQQQPIKAHITLHLPKDRLNCLLAQSIEPPALTTPQTRTQLASHPLDYASLYRPAALSTSTLLVERTTSTSFCCIYLVSPALMPANPLEEKLATSRTYQHVLGFIVQEALAPKQRLSFLFRPILHRHPYILAAGFKTLPRRLVTVSRVGLKDVSRHPHRLLYPFYDLRQQTVIYLVLDHIHPYDYLALCICHRQ